MEEEMKTEKITIDKTTKGITATKRTIIRTTTTKKEDKIMSKKEIKTMKTNDMKTESTRINRMKTNRKEKINARSTKKGKIATLLWSLHPKK